MENVFVIRVNFNLEPDLTEEEMKEIERKEKKRIRNRVYFVKNKEKILQYNKRQDIKDKNNARRRQMRKEDTNFVIRKSISDRKSYLKHKEERLQKCHDYYQKNKKMVSERGKKYRDSFERKILETYNSMVFRSKKKGFTEIIERQDFFNFALSNQQYKQLYDNWILNNKEYRLTPSIDRIDATKPYILNNIQFLSVSDNAKKRNLEYPKGYKIKATKGDDVKYFESIGDFSYFLGYKHKTGPHLERRENNNVRGWDYEILNSKKGDE